MKSRFSVFKHRYRLIESKAMRRLGKSPDDGKLEFADILICCSIISLLNLDLLPESVPYREHIMIIVTSAIVLLGLFLKLRRLAPRTCWERATWATGLIAVVWSLLPWIIYYAESEGFNLEFASIVSLMSIVMWLICLGCFLRLRFIRRRSRLAIAAIRLRAKRRKAQYL